MLAEMARFNNLPSPQRQLAKSLLLNGLRAILPLPKTAGHGPCESDLASCQRAF